MYDAIIVGARCGGAPTAMLLAQQGFSVLLVDRATFPSDTLSTLIIHCPGVRALERWGVLDQVMHSNCPSILHWSIDYGGHTLSGRPLPLHNIITIAPRRTVLDKILIDSAVSAGVELWEGFVVDQFLVEDGRIIGIQGHTSSKKVFTERTSIVIGADGKHSKLARILNAPMYNVRPAQAFYYYTFWKDLPVKGIEGYWRPGHFVLAIPTNDSETCLVVGQPRDQFPLFRKNIEQNYLRTVAEAAPCLRPYLSDSRRVDRFFGTSDLPNFYRKPFGNGWALVGDAGLCMDPLGGYGIMNAFLDAELLASALEQGLSDPQNFTAVLANYEQERNERTIQDYERNWQSAKLVGWDEGPNPYLFAALREDPEEKRYFLAAYAHAISREDFFARPRIVEIMKQIPKAVSA